jgi:phenylalanyl-tRNA synthetase beta chain
MLKTLDEQERKLTTKDLIITDDDKPIALAGVMGGYDTEVTDSTINLLIESAYFDKVSIMKTSRRLNLISDASIRFERGIDFNIQKHGLQRFVNLFENDQNINYSSIIDSSKNGISYDTVSFEKSKIEQILGVELEDNFIRNTLSKLQIVSEVSDEKIIFESPSWRYDLERPIDLIEELAKHYGFNNFESTLPIGNNLNSKGDYWDKRLYLSKKLSSTNFYEIQTLSFTDSVSNELFTPEKKSVNIINPIDQTQENLRTNLLTSLINTYKFNFENNGKSNRYYEINNIYDNSKHKKFKTIPNQEYSLGLLLPEKESIEDRRGKTISNKIDTLTNTIKSLFPSSELEHLTRPGFHKNYSYLIKLENKVIGFMGKLSYKVESELELKNSLYIAQINTENFNFDQIRDFDYKPLSAYPFIKFDLSFSVPIDFQASDLTNYIESIISENENNISIFDNFTNEKTRNLGIRIITRSYEKTYTETESTEILEMIVKEVESKFKLKLNKRDENAI